MFPGQFNPAAPPPVLAAAALAEGGSPSLTATLSRCSHTLEANWICINGGFHPFIGASSQRESRILYLVQPGVHVLLLKILCTKPLPVDAATDGRGLK